MHHHTAQGTWTPRKARLHINILELRVVCLVCKAFLPVKHSLRVQIISDSIITVVYINKQGEMRSHPLCLEAVRLCNWCFRNQITIQAAYLPGIHKSLEDSFSTDHEWKIPDSSHQHICTVGYSPMGPLWVQDEQEACHVLLQGSHRLRFPGQCFPAFLDGQPQMCLSSHPTTIRNCLEDPSQHPTGLDNSGSWNS